MVTNCDGRKPAYLKSLKPHYGDRRNIAVKTTLTLLVQKSNYVFDDDITAKIDSFPLFFPIL